MSELLLSLCCLFLTGLPAAMIFRNLKCFRTLPPSPSESPSPISILIPVRSEANGIQRTLECLRNLRGVEFEIIVLDDHSEDETVALVEAIAREEPNLRLHHSRPLPSGWNGKQHACWQLSQHARFDRLLFMDADVHLQPDAVARLSSEMDQRQSNPDDATENESPLMLLSAFLISKPSDGWRKDSFR
ncbi:MAG: glycosyltransferase family A protein [Pirellulaceae bacterium]